MLAVSEEWPVLAFAFGLCAINVIYLVRLYRRTPDTKG